MWLLVAFACVGLALATARAAESADVAAVKAVLKAYKTALEKLDAAPATKLFTADAQVFESGGVEGTFPARDIVIRYFARANAAQLHARGCSVGSHNRARDGRDTLVALKHLPQVGQPPGNALLR